jgi:hypothetical protein
MQRSRSGSSVSSWLNFTPLSLNPQLWLDAADTATITESSGAVSQWDDKSGNGRHFTQATGANQPATGTNTRNGLNVISFDGNDFLTLGTNDLARNVSGATIYVVYQHAANPTGDRRIFNINNGTASGFVRVLILDGVTSQRTQTGGRTLDADSFASVTGSIVISTNYLYRASIFDYANTDLFNYVNGILDASTTSFQTATTTSNTASIRARVGADVNVTPATFFSGQIAEILVYHTAHTTAQRLTVETYLKTKWGL